MSILGDEVAERIFGVGKEGSGPVGGPSDGREGRGKEAISRESGQRPMRRTQVQRSVGEYGTSTYEAQKSALV